MFLRKFFDERTACFPLLELLSPALYEHSALRFFLSYLNLDTSAIHRLQSRREEASAFGLRENGGEKGNSATAAILKSAAASGALRIAQPHNHRPHRLWQGNFPHNNRARTIKFTDSLLQSTLTDRLLHITGAVSPTQIAARAQYLDSNPIERARQITIKARAATLTWKNSSITLIDCPGHHDFSRQVLQTARAVEGALLLLDATQGVQAQTLTSVDHALHAGLELLPVINKIDLPTADVPMAKRQLEELIGLDGDDALLVSAKHGTGVPELLDAVTERLPTPLGNASDPLQAFVFDSYYDVYRGVVLLIRLINGTLRVGDVITPMSSASTSEASEYTVDQVGVLLPDEVSCAELRAGDIGFVTASVKRLADIPLGDTLTHVQQPALEPLARYEDPTPLVFCGLYPTDNSDANELRYALERLQLQDASVVFEPHVSDALGTGFRCGFLGLLHMAVTQERLEAEFGLSLISSAPSVSYKVSFPSALRVEISTLLTMLCA